MALNHKVGGSMPSAPTKLKHGMLNPCQSGKTKPNTMRTCACISRKDITAGARRQFENSAASASGAAVKNNLSSIIKPEHPRSPISPGYGRIATGVFGRKLRNANCFAGRATRIRVSWTWASPRQKVRTARFLPIGIADVIYVRRRTTDTSTSGKGKGNWDRNSMVEATPFKR